MVSKNSPETPATPQEPVSATLNGTAYTITGMDTKTGLEIYRNLPADAKVQADQIAFVLQTYASIQAVAVKHGMNPTELAKDWLTSASETNTAKDAASKFSSAQKAAVSELGSLGANARDVARMVPGGDAIMGTIDVASGAATISGVALSGAGAVLDGAFNGPTRIWNLASTMGAESWGKVFGYGQGSAKEPAQAFAAAVMALRLQETEGRHAMPMFDYNPFDDKQSQFGSNPWQYTKAGASWVGEWLAQWVPGAKYIIAAYEWLTYKGENKPTYSEFVSKAEADIAEAGKTRPANGARFSELADEAMWEKEGEKVRDALLAAKEVAGIDTTKGAADVATASTTTGRDENGNDVTIKNGKEVARVSPGQRMGTAWGALTGDGPLWEQGLRVGGAAWVTGQGIRGAAEGVARQGLVRPAAEAKAAEALVNKLNGKIDAAEAAPKTSKAQFWKADDAKIDAWKAARDVAKDEAITKGRLATSSAQHAGDFAKTAATPMKEINDGSKVKALWNAPRAVGRLSGDGASWSFGKLKDATVGAGKGAWHFATGTVDGAHVAVNEATVAKAAGMERVGQSVGKWGSRGLLAAAPVVSTIQTVGDIGRGDVSGAVVHGVQTGSVIGTMVVAGKVMKIGVGRATPILGGVMSGGEFVNAAVHGDTKGMKSAGVDLGLIGSGAAIGAGIGAIGGGVGAIPGAAVGATIGGFAVAGRAIYNWVAGDDAQVVPSAQAATVPARRDGAIGAVDPVLAQAAIDKAQEQAKPVFAKVKDVHSGVAPTSSTVPQSFTGLAGQTLRIG
jgi:hypothetical protein